MSGQTGLTGSSKRQYGPQTIPEWAGDDTTAQGVGTFDSFGKFTSREKVKCFIHEQVNYCTYNLTCCKRVTIHVRMQFTLYRFLMPSHPVMMMTMHSLLRKQAGFRLLQSHCSCHQKHQFTTTLPPSHPHNLAGIALRIMT